MKRHLTWVLAGLISLGVGGCKRGSAHDAAHAEDEHHNEPHHGATSAPTNRIDVPPAVRQNLGITFAKVERRRVASTLRVPGRFELLPSARREYRTGLAGRVELRVKQFDKVDAGAVLYRVESPEWHRLRQALQEAESAVERAKAGVTVAERARAEAEQAVTIFQSRVSALAGVDVKKADLDADLAVRRAALPRLEAELKAKQVELEEARRQVPMQVAAAAAAVGTTPETLVEEVGEGEERKPRWRTLDAFEVRARDAGVIESVPATNGAWVEAGGLVTTVIDPAAVRFAATGLQSDLSRLREGLAARIVAPSPGSSGGSDGHVAGIPGKLGVGLSHNAEQRSVDLYVTPESATSAVHWAKPGVSTFAEIVTDGSDDPELAIPVGSVIRDGLTHVYFRRDPKDPDKVIRVEADLGLSDGKWIVVNSGVAAGDEVVLDGVYELNLTGGGKAAGGGHFHADGTWHPDGTPEPGSKK
jgi:hypothetical protein